MNPQNIQAMLQMQAAMQQLQSSGIMPNAGGLGGGIAHQPTAGTRSVLHILHCMGLAWPGSYTCSMGHCTNTPARKLLALFCTAFLCMSQSLHAGAGAGAGAGGGMPDMSALMGMLGGAGGGIAGFGAPQPVTNPEETFAMQLTQLEVCHA